MKKRMLFVFNPKAGKGRIKTHLLDIVDIFNTQPHTTSSYLRFHQSEVCAVLYDISMFLSVP